jgi:hypothetical protein
MLGTLSIIFRKNVANTLIASESKLPIYIFVSIFLALFNNFNIKCNKIPDHTNSRL